LDLQDQLDLMVDRIIDLPKGARPIIEEAGYAWFQDGDNDDYIAEDAIMVHRDEIKAFEKASKEIYNLYIKALKHHQVHEQSKGQFNYMISELTIVFRRLRNKFPDKIATLLLTALGHIEDKLNLDVIKEAAEEAGFEVDYANLEDVIFDEDGVFLQDEENYIQYNFVYKLVPWEFIMLEEPELMDILTDLSINHGLVVLNPAYSVALQAKQMLPILHELFPDNPYILPCYDNKDALSGKKYVRKTNFGRMGENVKIVQSNGETLAKTKGEFGSFSKVFQSYADMYADEDGDIYQAQMYVGEGVPCCLSFRRRDDAIIDDDSEFVTHVIFE